MATVHDTGRLDPTDYLPVRSRASWSALFAGAMVALTIYLVLTLLGLALGLEAVSRGGERGDVGIGAAIWGTLTLLVAFFFGGWATTRMAVGETKFEAVLHGLILWGLLFLGIISLVGSGVRAGFGGMVGLATGVYGDDGGRVDKDAIVADLKEAGLPADQVDKARAYYEDPRQMDVSSADVVRVSRKAAWWSLLGVVFSLAAVMTGALTGSGDLPVAVPLLGVRRRLTGPIVT